MIKLLPKDHTLFRPPEPTAPARRKTHPWRRVFALVGALALIILIPSALVVYFHPSKAQASWFDTNWGFRQRIDTTITSSSSDISNLETLITVNTSTLISASKLQSSCQDLRFTNVNGKVLNYYIDSGCNTTTTKIWVMADLVPKNTTVYTLYMYYGNTLAAAGSNSHYFDNVVGLVGYWTMNDASSGSSTTVTDSSVNANPGTWNGTLGSQWTSSGQYSNAGVFNGTDNYVDMGNPSFANGGSQMTWSMWIKPTSLVLLKCLFCKFNNASTQVSWGIETGLATAKRLIIGIPTSLSDGSTYAETTNDVFTTGQWTHIVGVFDGTQTNNQGRLKIYVNGALQALTYTGTIPASIPTGSTANMRLGATSDAARFFNGQIDDVHIYNTARTAQQITADYANTSCGGLTCTIATSPVGTSGPSTSFAAEESSTAPMLWWKFDDGTGTTTKDSTSNANTGTLGGTTVPTWQTEDLCISGKCLFFDGASSKVTGSKVANNVQSVAFWIRPNTIATQGLLNLDGGTHKISTNSLGFISASGFTSPTYYVNGVATTTPTLTQNQWNYVEITTGTSFNTTSSFTVGTDGTNFIKGFFDEVKFYNYARSATQAQADFLIGQAKIGGSSSTSNNQSQFLSQGLVGYWRMDEASWNGTSGEVKDSSGNGNNGTGTNGVTTGAGKFGNAGNFDGTNDNVNIYSSNLNSTFNHNEGTLAVWAKVSGSGVWTNGAQGRIVQLTADGNNYVLLFKNSVTNELDVLYSAGGTVNVASTTSLAGSTNWFHMVLTWSKSNNQVKMYLNGTQAGTTQTGLGTFVGNLSPSQTVIGAQDTSGDLPWSGQIDETRLYNRALSAQEVSQLYTYAPGPVGWWKMDERTGTSAFDSSGNANTGTLTNSPVWTAGKYGSALTFNGTNNYVSLNDSRNLSPDAHDFTVSAWVKTNVLDGADHWIFSNYGGTLIDLALLRLTNSHFSAFYRDGSSNTANATDTLTLSTKTWYYVSAVRSGTTSILYVNGVQAATATNASLGTIFASNGTVPAIGTDIPNPGNYWNGQIDDVRVYNYARTQAQIQQDMQGSTNANTNSGGSTATSQPAAPLAYWKFDEGYGTTANNDGSGGSALNGTLTNMASPATSTSGWQVAASNCKINKCLAFSGSYVNMGNQSSLNFERTDTFSISTWVKTTGDTTGVHAALVTKTAGGGSLTGWWFELNNNKPEVYLINTFGSNYIYVQSSGRTINDGNWHHVVITYSGSSTAAGVNIYVDGILQGKTVNSDTLSASMQSSGSVNIGTYNNGTSNFFAGTLDEPKIYNYALTADQVRNDYNLGAAVNYSGGTNEAANQTSGAGNAPIADWEFEERTGTTVNDSSGNSNTGTWNGTGTTHWTIGKVGSSGKFNGTTDYVSVPDASALDITGDMTVEAWVKPSIIDSTNRIFLEKGDGVTAANRQYGLRLNSSNQWAFFQYSGSTTNSTTDGTTVPSTSRWDHIVGVKSGTNLLIYTNGVLQHTSTSASTTNTSANILALGRAGAASSNYFGGQVDSVKIFNYARSADQIAYDYNRGAPVGWWKFDECQGTTAHDSSANANHGTITIGASGTQTAVGTCNTAGTAWGNGAVGKYSSSLNFDGTDDYVDMGNASIFNFGWTNSFTLSAWIKTSQSSGSYRTIIRNSNSGTSKGYIFNINSGLPTLYLVATWSSHIIGVNSQTIVNDNKWHHVVATYNGSKLASGVTVYVDGIANDVVLFDTLNADFAAGQNVQIANGTSWNWYSGQIDDVRIYNYALTQTQVNLLYNNGGDVFYGPTTGNPSN